MSGIILFNQYNGCGVLPRAQMKAIAGGGSVVNPAGAACLIGLANVVDNDNFLDSSK
jgi:hypothetical protein